MALPDEREQARDDAATLRDTADILDRLAKNPRRSPPSQTGIAMLAAGLRREAERIEDDWSNPGTGENHD